MDAFKPRDEIVDYLRSALMGPLNGENEVVNGTPFLRYMTGMLFPLGGSMDEANSRVSGSAEESNESADKGTPEDVSSLSDGIHLAFETLPSAVGLSFRVPDQCSIECNIQAARYLPFESEKSKGKGRSQQSWERHALSTEPEALIVKKGMQEVLIFDGIARLDVRWRSLKDSNAIVTITVVNNQINSKRGLDIIGTLFQVSLKCSPTGVHVLPYPELATAYGADTEDAEVAFLYKSSTPFARGHGCASNWTLDENGHCISVETDFMPSAFVPYATFNLAVSGVNKACFDVGFLDAESRVGVIKALKTLSTTYGNWVSSQALRPVENKFEEVSKRFVQRANTWLRRIDCGIAILESDDLVWKAFRLANRAMGMQMLLSRSLKEGTHDPSEGGKPPKFDFNGLYWRPFQIAFILASLDSLCNPKSSDREVVDIIWFPTGGGKTEAYLLVTAFELVHRRLKHRNADYATGVLSRYTLRMLTAQQFQRTSALIVALEVLRRGKSDELGSRPFSLGLWVGNSLTPNRFRDAHLKFNQLLESNYLKNDFLLNACPYCATNIIPRKPKKTTKGWLKSDIGIRSTESEFYFYCPNVECEFHQRLPLNVVDEALYADPPSMLLGTLDKFAQLSWGDSARVFFGGIDDKSLPPSLIIQDELHLISGPLGSLAAPYEVAIDAIIRSRGVIPKRIGSTATIRNAAEQVRGLYGRECSVFPSPCGRWDDAFFFRSETERPGRQYLGIMGQGYIKPVVAMAWTAAAALQSAAEIALPPEALDSYWTLLAYHNSRRELGRTLTAARDEVATRIKSVASSQAKARSIGEPLELSANMVSSMSEALDDLMRKHTPAQPAVDFVPCTSIVSVGVDVDRLGLMMVNGQPKLTSEYIQATSRVGRGNIPGLVLTLYSPSKPRDRSHYEDFRAYHESIYKHVEPTSVTPYALPARTRTLHAAIVALVRNALPWHKFDQAGNVDFDLPATKQAIQDLLKIMRASDSSEAAAVEALVLTRIDEWVEYAISNAPLLYEARQAGAQFAALLFEFGKAGARGLWPTMMSVRNVDSDVMVSVQ